MITIKGIEPTDVLSKPWGRYDFSKDSLAVVAFSEEIRGGMCVLWTVGAHVRMELKEYGLSPADVLLEPDGDGIWIWEGRGVWTPGGFECPEDGETVLEGTYRKPTEEEWAAIRDGRCPWNDEELKGRSNYGRGRRDHADRAQREVETAMTLQDLLDMPPEEFRSLAEATVESTKRQGWLHRPKGMTDFLCAVHCLQRSGWKRAPRSEIMRITGHSDRTNRLYASWQTRCGTINRKGNGFKHKPTLRPDNCRSYSLEPNKFFCVIQGPLHRDRS